jgi:hypothetical protein
MAPVSSDAKANNRVLPTNSKALAEVHPARPGALPIEESEWSSERLSNARTNGLTQQDKRFFDEQLARFTNAARVYRFDPVPTGLVNYVRRYGTDMVFNTATHTVAFTNRKLNKFVSMDDSTSLGKPENLLKNLASVSGTWTEQAAVEATRNILESLGEETTLRAWQGGTHRYEAPELTERMPDGSEIKRQPFHSVWLLNSNGVGLAHAEFRLDAQGVPRLVDWFHNVR